MSRLPNLEMMKSNKGKKGNTVPQPPNSMYEVVVSIHLLSQNILL